MKEPLATRPNWRENDFVWKIYKIATHKIYMVYIEIFRKCLDDSKMLRRKCCDLHLTADIFRHFKSLAIFSISSVQYHFMRSNFM